MMVSFYYFSRHVSLLVASLPVGLEFQSLPSNLTHKHCLPNANINPCCCLKVEKLARTLFLWKIEVHEQKEKVYEMRRWNEALVTNMLPEHVARHFLGSKKRDEVTSSYSHIRNMLVLNARCV